MAAPRLALLRIELLFDLDTDSGDDLFRSSLRAGPRGPLDVVATRSMGRLFTWIYMLKLSNKMTPHPRKSWGSYFGVELVQHTRRAGWCVNLVGAVESGEVDVDVVVVSPIEDHRLKAVTPKNLIGQVGGPG